MNSGSKKYNILNPSSINTPNSSRKSNKSLKSLKENTPSTPFNSKIRPTFSEIKREKEKIKLDIIELFKQIDNIFSILINEREESNKTWIEIFEGILNTDKFINHDNLIPRTNTIEGSLLLEYSKFWILYLFYKNSKENIKLSQMISLFNNCLNYDVDDIKLIYEFFIHIINTYQKEEILVKLPKERNVNLQNLNVNEYKYLIDKPHLFLMLDDNRSLQKFDFFVDNARKPPIIDNYSISYSDFNIIQLKKDKLSLDAEILLNELVIRNKNDLKITNEWGYIEGKSYNMKFLKTQKNIDFTLLASDNKLIIEINNVNDEEVKENIIDTEINIKEKDLSDSLIIDFQEYEPKRRITAREAYERKINKSRNKSITKKNRSSSKIRKTSSYKKKRSKPTK